MSRNYIASPNLLYQTAVLRLLMFSRILYTPNYGLMLPYLLYITPNLTAKLKLLILSWNSTYASI
jgi:hypothetical protein